MQQVFVIVDYVRTDFYRNLVLCNLLYLSIKVAIMSSSCANVAMNTSIAEIRGFSLKMLKICMIFIPDTYLHIQVKINTEHEE